MRFVVTFRTACACLLAASLYFSAPGQAQGPALRPEILPREAAELEIALGRIRMVPDRFRIVRKHEQFAWPTPAAVSATNELSQEQRKEPGSNTDPAKTCNRSLHVTANEGRPTLKLSYSDTQERWTLVVDQLVGAEWTRELLTKQPLVTVQYRQPPHQSITVTITGATSKPKTLKAATLWHLTEQNQPEFAEYVLPALLRLNSTWDLHKALAAAKRMRGYTDLSGTTNSKHELAQYISQLDSSDRHVREAAKQKLRDTGLAAHIPLEQLRSGPLTPQQRSTVDELLAELEPRTADTPTRLAYWLAGDPSWK